MTGEIQATFVSPQNSNNSMEVVKGIGNYDRLGKIIIFTLTMTYTYWANFPKTYIHISILLFYLY